jgi:hypothetical protein
VPRAFQVDLLAAFHALRARGDDVVARVGARGQPHERRWERDAVDEHGRAGLGLVQIHDEGRDARRDLVVERLRALAGFLELDRLALLGLRREDVCDHLARLDEHAQRDLRARDLDARGRHVHDRIGCLEALERGLRVFLVVAEIAPLIHQVARGLFLLRRWISQRGRRQGERHRDERP